MNSSTTPRSTRRFSEDDPHPLILALMTSCETEGTGPAGSAPSAFFLGRRTLALPGLQLSVLESLELQPESWLV